MLYWVWLSRLKGVGPIIQKRLLDYFKSPQNIYNAQTTEIKQIIGIGDRLSKNIKETSLKEAYKILDKVNRLNIKILTYNNPLYSKKAKGYTIAFLGNSVDICYINLLINTL